MSRSLALHFPQAVASGRSGDGGVDREQLRETVEALYVTRHSLVFRYLMSITRDPSEAEDLTQEVFLRLFDYCAAGHVVENVVNWLLVVGRNLAIDRTRNRRYELKRCEGFWARVLRTRADWRANAEQHAIATDHRDEVRRVLSCLTDTEKSCLLLRSRGFQYGEIAGELNISIWSAAHYTSRAVRKLKRRLGEAPKAR